MVNRSSSSDDASRDNIAESRCLLLTSFSGSFRECGGSAPWLLLFLTTSCLLPNGARMVPYQSHVILKGEMTRTWNGMMLHDVVMRVARSRNKLRQRDHMQGLRKRGLRRVVDRRLGHCEDIARYQKATCKAVGQAQRPDSRPVKAPRLGAHVVGRAHSGLHHAALRRSIWSSLACLAAQLPLAPCPTRYCLA